MKKTVFLLAMFIASINCPAEPSVVADLKELYKVEREWRTTSMSREEHRAYLEKIKERAKPIVSKEFAALAKGEITPLARELLNSPEAMDFCWDMVLVPQIRSYATNTQAIALSTAFKAMPDSFRGTLLQIFVKNYPIEYFPDDDPLSINLSKEVFSSKEIQSWLVEKINGGLPAGAFYFILTDESAEAVSETARAGMKRYPDPKGGNTFNLLSAAFLASRGDEEAIAFLASLMDNLDIIKSSLDKIYVVPAAAMSGNEKLIQKIRDIITKDNLSRFYEESSNESSFAHFVIQAFSLVIKDFPYVGPYFGRDNEKMKKPVRDWLENNPTHTIKPDAARVFFSQSSFESIMPAMRRAGWKE